MAGKRKTPKSSKSSSKCKKIPKVEPQVKVNEEEEFVLQISDEEDELAEINDEPAKINRRPGPQPARKKRENDTEEMCNFVGEPVAVDDALRRWPHRYISKTSGKQAAKSISQIEKCQARRHYTQANVDGIIYFLGDDAHVLAEPGKDHYICRIVEMFEGVDGEPYITAQWFYRAKDTVIECCSKLIDDKRIFLSTIKDDNSLDCLLEKIKIVHLPLKANLNPKEAAVAECHYYYDMMYYVPSSSFLIPQHDGTEDENESVSTISSESDVHRDEANKDPKEIKLLDLYSGCGAMSTGLCLGANLASAKLVTKWAVDINQYACQSLEHNHPETEVRNEKAEDFLALLKEWEKLCVLFSLIGDKNSQEQQTAHPLFENEGDDDEEDEEEEDNPEIFEVDKILSVCYGDPRERDQPGLYFKVSWKGYGEDEDSWEPVDGLSGAREKIKDFVTTGFYSNMLPLPGDADVICGGPPCQGISGFNRFRNTENPLEDPKNKQLLVFMDIVEHLKPRFVLMENVVDIVKFAGGFLGRYALGRLVGMNYQARMGMMAAGAYGLPQYRNRMFMWGALHTEKLPQYPLPTHNVVVRGNTPLEFGSLAVTYDEDCAVELEDKLFLGDAISDLPPVENNEARDEMPYGTEPITEFQKFIRLRKEEMLGLSEPLSTQSKYILYDHRPLRLNEDDYARVCHVPVKKGANFRDFKGVRVGADKKVELDPDVERVYLPSGKPLVPDYAISFVRGTSNKPFRRLWWDETVPTVVTRAEPHNQAITHPTQNRVLSIRENARLQGFPDYYKLFGPVKERYIQVGNAVAVPVARALGYSLGLSMNCGAPSEEPVFTLPRGFPKISANVS